MKESEIFGACDAFCKLMKFVYSLCGKSHCITPAGETKFADIAILRVS
jgi:hypothetical protein